MAKPDYASSRSSRKSRDVETGSGQSYYPRAPPVDDVPCSPPLITPAQISANNEELRQVAQVILQETAKLRRKRKILSTIFIIVFVVSMVSIVILLVVRHQRPRQYVDT